MSANEDGEGNSDLRENEHRSDLRRRCGRISEKWIVAQIAAAMPSAATNNLPDAIYDLFANNNWCFGYSYGAFCAAILQASNAPTGIISDTDELAFLLASYANLGLGAYVGELLNISRLEALQADNDFMDGQQIGGEELLCLFQMGSNSNAMNEAPASLYCRLVPSNAVERDGALRVFGAEKMRIASLFAMLMKTDGLSYRGEVGQAQSTGCAIAFMASMGGIISGLSYAAVFWV